MRPFDIIFSAAFLIALWAGSRRFDKIAGERKVLATRCAELEGKLKKIEEEKTDTLNRVREYYDRERDGKNEKIAESEEMHKGFKELAVFFAEELERVNPGWYERRKKEAEQDATANEHTNP